MAAITYGATGLLFGATAETGVAIISVRRNATAGKKEVSNQDGDIIGRGTYGFKAEYSCNFTTLGSTGLAGASVGSTYSLANSLNQNGVSGGTFIVDQVSIDFNHEDFQTGTADITQYPAI